MCPGRPKGAVMFTLEWRELAFLAVVGLFWLVTLKRIYEWWHHDRTLRRVGAADPPHP
jgi:hypothetical protein